MEDDFNYWDPEHYEIKEVSGSEKLCIDAFNAEAKKYPPMLYGTHILLKEFNEEKDEFEITIRRFKTKELCKLHVLYPPVCVRKGEIL